MAYSRSILAIVLGVSLFSLAGCGQQSQPTTGPSTQPSTQTSTDPSSGTKSALLDPEGNFTLYVSNQSFAIDPVDIKLSIDNQDVVDQDFYVKNQHKNWRTYRLSLNPGPHILRVESKRGNARLEKTFEVKGRHWAAVNFNYDRPTDYGQTTKQFFFHISSKPIGFE